MKTYENIITLSRAELKGINKDTVKLTVNTASHVNTINEIATALKAEVDAYKDAVKAIAGYTDFECKTVKVENRPAETFNKADFIAVYGEAEYKRFCTLKDKLYVTFKG